MQRLGIVHGPGSAGPMEVVRGCSGLAEPVFLAPQDDIDQALTATIDLLGCALHRITTPVPEPAELASLGLDGVTTFSERRVPLTAAIARLLGTPGQSPQAAIALTDKAVQRAALRAAGLPVPAVTVLDRADQVQQALLNHTLPVVLKPRRGEASRSTLLIRDPAQATPAALADAGLVDEDGAAGWLVEQCLLGQDRSPLGDYVSVESVVQEGTVLRSSVTDKFPLVPPFREIGAIAPNQLDAGLQLEVAELAARALAAVSFTDGVTHTELKLTPDGPRVIEVNGRLGGGVRLPTLHAAGFDLLRDAICVALGLPPESAVQPSPGVAGYYLLLAPETLGRLTRVRGAAAARRVPGVVRYEPLAAIGDVVGTSVRTQPIGRLNCVGAELDDIWATLGAFVDAISFEFTDPADSTAPARTVRGRELPSARMLPAVRVPGGGDGR